MDFVYLSDREITSSMTEDEQQLLLNDLYRAHRRGSRVRFIVTMCCDTDKGRFHRASAMDRAVRRWNLNDNDNSRSIENDANISVWAAG